ncbi:MAG: GNAT family N-acetyltransferase [Acholeplasmataceae bacterium]|nr:GNAT family N-acetyltransferase [Acholeplasmataceae bacterium]
MNQIFQTPIPVFIIRTTNENDVSLILSYIRKLAIYEKMEEQVIATVEGLRKTLFDQKYAEVLLAYESNQPVGFALFFHNYSTFQGKPNLFLEDLFIDEAYRGKGYGKLMFACLAKIAVKRGCSRLDWCCLNWNESALQFYQNLGGKHLNTWFLYRLQDNQLKAVASLFEK